MTDDRDDNPTGLLPELPIQPTGSGVADLAVAIEQAAVREGDAPAGGDAGDGGAGEVQAHPS